MAQAAGNKAQAYGGILAWLFFKTRPLKMIPLEEVRPAGGENGSAPILRCCQLLLERFGRA